MSQMCCSGLRGPSINMRHILLLLCTMYRICKKTVEQSSHETRHEVLLSGVLLSLLALSVDSRLVPPDTVWHASDTACFPPKHACATDSKVLAWLASIECDAGGRLRRTAVALLALTASALQQDTQQQQHHSARHSAQYASAYCYSRGGTSLESCPLPDPGASSGPSRCVVFLCGLYSVLCNYGTVRCRIIQFAA